MKRKNHIRTPVSDSEALARAYHVSKSSSKDSFFGFFRALGKNKSACFGAVILLIFFLTAVFGPLLIDADVDLKAVVYFVTVAVLFNFFTVQSVEKRRWS